MSIRYFVPFEAERKAGTDNKPSNVLVIRGKAVDSSVNANRWAILPQDLDMVAQELAGVPMLTDHEASVFNIVGKVVKGERKDDEVYFEAEVVDERLIRLVESGLVKYVSISVDPEKTVCSVCNKETRDSNGNLIHLCPGAHEIVVKPHVRELSFVVFPAYKDAEIQPIGFASAMNKYLKTDERAEGLKPLSRQDLNVEMAGKLRVSEKVNVKTGEKGMSEKKAQVETTVPQVEAPSEEKGKAVTYEELYNILNKFTEQWKQVAEDAVKRALDEAKKSEEAKKTEEAKKLAEEAKKKAEEVEEAKKKAEEDMEDIDEVKKVEEASVKPKVSFGVTNAPAMQGSYPDWFMELWQASKKQRGMA
jgi:hypothetical protein